MSRPRATPSRLRPLVLLGAGLLAGMASPPARADFGPIELQSVDAREQARTADEPALSRDGRYLAFQGSIGGLAGVLRKDLRTGQIELVTGGSAYNRGPLIEAAAPSISADGRYVSFTSPAALVPAAHPGENVYVRDMDRPAPATGSCTPAEAGEGSCAFELASARDHSDAGLTYGPGGGALASGRVALSASGREVVFVTTGASDLTSAVAGEPSTPGPQVAVRYLDRRETVLVSAQREAVSGEMSELPVAGGAVTPTAAEGSTAPGAALSGDGSTVAWLGAHIAAQAPTLSGERQQIEADDQHPGISSYDEPLWRRIADGPAAPTRRMVGGGDPLAPGCPPGASIAVPACQGPYPMLPWESMRGDEGSNYGWLGITHYNGVPQLSDDGYTAALIGDPDSTSNVFVIDMHEGLTRVQALRQLTRELPVANVINPGTNSEFLATAGDVYAVAISSDGSRIAFTTQRQQFPLAPPNYGETPPQQLGALELYEINRVREALVRVTHGPDRGPSLEGNSFGTVTQTGAASPSYSGDGLTLAFADTASNLVFGDANNASDAFTVTDHEQPQPPGSAQIGSAPPGPEPTPRWMLSVVAVARRDGSFTLEAVLPGAGELSARALATVPIPRVARGGRAGARRTRRPARGRGRDHRAGRSELGSRTVAAARISASAAGLIELPLRVSAPYASLLETPAGIYASVRVTFTGTGGPPLAQTLPVSLRRSAALKRKGGRRR